MDGILITRASLHAALVEIEARGRTAGTAAVTGGLAALQALLKPGDEIAAAAAESGRSLNGATATVSTDPPEAGPPAPPTIETPTEPGTATLPAEDTSAGGGAPTSPPQPPESAQAAEGTNEAEAAGDAPPGDTCPPVPIAEARLTSERATAFPALWRDPSLSLRQVRDRLNALAGPSVPHNTALYEMAKRLGLPNRGTYAAPAKAPTAEIQDQASAPVVPADGRETPAPVGEPATRDAEPAPRALSMASAKRRARTTPERIEAIQRMWPDRAFTGPMITRALNKMAGDPIENSAQLYMLAKTAGLPTRREEIFAGQDAAALAAEAAIEVAPDPPPPPKPRAPPAAPFRKPETPLPPQNAREARADFDPKSLDPLDNGLGEPPSVTTARGLLREGYGEAYVSKLSRLPPRQVSEIARQVEAERRAAAAPANPLEGSPA